MQTISIKHEVPMGHRLQRHEGKCRFLHGHNYLFTISVSGHVDGLTGMIMDFSDLKKIVKSVLDPLDHAMMLEDNDPTAELIQFADPAAHPRKLILTNCAPTAENIATMVLNEIWQKFDPENRTPSNVLAVKVNETRDSEAIARVSNPRLTMTMVSGE